MRFAPSGIRISGRASPTARRGVQRISFRRRTRNRRNSMRRTVFGIAVVTMLQVLAANGPTHAAQEGTLTVAVATFGNERWLPHLYVGAEDIVLKPLWENLLNRDTKGVLIPMLAERWEVLDGGRTWKFHLRKGVKFHNGTEVTAEDVRYTFTQIAREGSANSLVTEFRLIKSLEIETPYTI